MRRLLPARLGGFVAGLAYLSMGLSLWFRPPPAAHGQVAAADYVANTQIWAFVFFGLAVLFAVKSYDATAFWQHGIGMTVVGTYAIASVASSINNNTGWTVATLCFVVASGHYFTMRRG